VGINNERASYSNYGPSIDVAAPGGDNTPDLNGDGMPDSILSTIGDDAGFGGGITLIFDGAIGTSMATPHIAGVISLMKAVNPDLTPQNFDDLLKSGQITNELGPVGRDDNFGYGLIDAQKAVSAAMELGGVAVPEPDPQLVVNPASLNFGLSRTNTTLTLSNGGCGDLQIINISDDSGGFLSWEGVGLGNYIIRVDRSGLSMGTFTATFTITSNVNTVKIPVILQVGDPNATGDAGFHYIRELRLNKVPVLN
jgi:serine protease